MNLKSNNKPPRSPELQQESLNEAKEIELWVRMVESETFDIAFTECLKRFKELHPTTSQFPHTHAHNLSSVMAVVSFKQLLIDTAYELKNREPEEEEESQFAK